MTLLYTIGILLTVLFNRRWTFDHQGFVTKAFIRYISSMCLAAYLILAALFLFVDKLEFPHQPVQGILIFVVAVLLFLLQRFWVFNDKQQEAI
ncbi:GtrA family protein [Thermodesulfobacteriota bacterium]